jgi:long-chain fatty acid transport protein
MSADLTSRTPAGVKFFDASADDFDVGFTAGLLFEPSEMTSIGIGFRSSVSHALKGDANILTSLGPINPDITASFKSPETVTIGLRQKLNDRATLLAGLEWANWSRFKELRIKADATGATLGVTDEQWKDSWLVSLGGEFAFDDKLTLRAGAAYEKSPVPDATMIASGLRSAPPMQCLRQPLCRRPIPMFS